MFHLWYFYFRNIQKVFFPVPAKVPFNFNLMYKFLWTEQDTDEARNLKMIFFTKKKFILPGISMQTWAHMFIESWRLISIIESNRITGLETFYKHDFHY